MSRASGLILLGVLTILAPLSGLPIAIRSMLSIILGALVLAVGFSLRTRTRSPEAPVTTIPLPPAGPSAPHGVSPI